VGGWGVIIPWVNLTVTGNGGRSQRAAGRKTASPPPPPPPRGAAAAHYPLVGGVMVTLAGLCSATRIDMKDEGDHELDRNWERINAIRQKQTSKPHGSPLPQ
jgi:hypothetical protein